MLIRLCLAVLCATSVAQTERTSQVRTRLDFLPPVTYASAVLELYEGDAIFANARAETLPPFSIITEVPSHPDALRVILRVDSPEGYVSLHPAFTKQPMQAFSLQAIEVRRRADAYIYAVTNHPTVEYLERAKQLIDSDAQALRIVRLLAGDRDTVQERLNDYEWLYDSGHFSNLGDLQLGYLQEYLDLFLHEFGYGRQAQPVQEFSAWIVSEPDMFTKWNGFVTILLSAYPATFEGGTAQERVAEQLRHSQRVLFNQDS